MQAIHFQTSQFSLYVVMGQIWNSAKRNAMQGSAPINEFPKALNNLNISKTDEKDSKDRTKTVEELEQQLNAVIGNPNTTMSTVKKVHFDETIPEKDSMSNNSFYERIM